eukprot:tig00021137_g18975.t1
MSGRPDVDADGDVEVPRRPHNAHRTRPCTRHRAEELDDAFEAPVLSDVHVDVRGDGGAVHVTAFHFVDEESDLACSPGAGGGAELEPPAARVSGGREAVAAASSKRRNKIEIEHRLATPLSMVGAQVWMASLLLADFVLANAEWLAGRAALELGSGPGLSGIAAARVARRVFLTDYKEGIVELAERNAARNAAGYRHGPSAAAARVLDWSRDWPPPLGGGRLGWTEEDLEALRGGRPALLAADGGASRLHPPGPRPPPPSSS